MTRARDDDASNAAFDAATGLRMDPDRANQFTTLLSNVHRAVHSLEVVASHFRGLDVANGEMDPSQTIRAFACAMREDIELAFQMLANEEEPDLPSSRAGMAHANATEMGKGTRSDSGRAIAAIRDSRGGK